MARRGTAGPDDADDVHDVLAEIDAEEGRAQVDSRLDELERDVARVEATIAESERGRRGELDVMRARIEDALEVLEATTEEHRSAWTRLEQRLAELQADAESATLRAVESLREDLAPRVHAVGLQADELEARLRGEVGALTDDLDARLGTFTDELAAVRRELDGSLGELRASHNLHVRTIEERLEALQAELAADAEERGGEVAGRQRALEDRLAGVDQRLQEVTTSIHDGLGRARDGREGLERSVRERLDELTTRIEHVDGRTVNQTGRHLAELGQLHRAVEELGGRVEVLTRRVADAVDGVAGDLQTKVGSVSAEVAAIREAGVRQEERLSSADRALRRVAELEERMGELATRVQDAEHIARSAGQAIANAVRRSRGAGSGDPLRRVDPPDGDLEGPGGGVDFDRVAGGRPEHGGTDG